MSRPIWHAMLGDPAHRCVGPIYNVQINLGSITDSQWVSEIRSQLASMVEECETLEAETRELVAKQIDAQQG